MAGDRVAAAALRVGDEVEVGGAAHTVTGLSGSQLLGLADVTGAESSMALAELLTAPGFRMLTRPPAALPPQGLLDGLPAEAAEQARWWERHVIEVITGVPPDARRAPGPGPSMTRRRADAAAAGAGQGRASWPRPGTRVSLSTLQRLRLAYEKRGLWGLVDHRAARQAGGPDDERVMQAIGAGRRARRRTGPPAR